MLPPTNLIFYKVSFRGERDGRGWKKLAKEHNICGCVARGHRQQCGEGRGGGFVEGRKGGSEWGTCVMVSTT